MTILVGNSVSNIAFVVYLLFTMGCAKSNITVETAAELSGPTMGTRYSIKYWSLDPEANADSLPADIDQLLLKINEQMSTYMPESELSRFNVASAGEWFDVSEETAFVTQQALHYHQITAGASDVTVGPLVKLWDFGPGRGSLGAKLEAPSPELLAKTMAQTGGEHLEARLDPPALRKSIEGLQVDLSSIAKGYAADAIAELITARSFTNFMVEIGGEVRAGGTRLDGKLWRIGVERPDLKQRTIHKIVTLQDQALATSGDYRNFREFDGQKVSHIIDPKTGRPMPYRGWSVTLLAPTCLQADALATALLVMGEDRGYDWCKEHQVAALFLIRQGTDKPNGGPEAEIIEKATPRWLQLTGLELTKHPQPVPEK